MASSTNIPRTIKMPIKEIKLIFTSNEGKKIKALKIEIGIPMAVQNAVLTFKNNKSEAKTKTNPILAFDFTNCSKSLASFE